jgi:hypothetical protein
MDHRVNLWNHTRPPVGRQLYRREASGTPGMPIGSFALLPEVLAPRKGNSRGNMISLSGNEVDAHRFGRPL